MFWTTAGFGLFALLKILKCAINFLALKPISKLSEKGLSYCEISEQRFTMCEVSEEGLA
jgi:hypothetical protein